MNGHEHTQTEYVTNFSSILQLNILGQSHANLIIFASSTPHVHTQVSLIFQGVIPPTVYIKCTFIFARSLVFIEIITGCVIIFSCIQGDY